jgi:hypothetical protein
MNIPKTSSTYSRYQAGAKSYAEFFDEGFYYKDNVGFCSMMRTIWFWRPAIAAARVVLISTAFAVVGAAWYHYSTEIMLGAVEIALLVGFMRLCKLVATVVGIKVYFEPEQMPLAFQWAKASHDKICPLVAFTEEEATCEE